MKIFQKSLVFDSEVYNLQLAFPKIKLNFHNWSITSKKTHEKFYYRFIIAVTYNSAITLDKIIYNLNWAITKFFVIKLL